VVHSFIFPQVVFTNQVTTRILENDQSRLVPALGALCFLEGVTVGKNCRSDCFELLRIAIGGSSQNYPKNQKERNRS